jgi:hypothetical protein
VPFRLSFPVHEKEAKDEENQDFKFRVFWDAGR